ncbi:hypothetical protein Taro_021137 [Colocasia esculenta]|uniref:Putative plant transposon protein domain-containing protein n=1 Tax=Colocasia esculenta TaxID=4460 RepID=A0A843UY55_COLES|nr:hypothetical protein [Colocasia esculenta]
MAAFGSSSSVGGYSAAFLMAEELERYQAVKIKICGNKAVDLDDLKKHSMSSVIEALQMLKWTEVCTVSEPSYPHLAKVFYTCLKSEEDGFLTSLAKGEAIIRDASTADVQEDEAVVREDEPTALERRIEDITFEFIEPFGKTSERVIPPPIFVPPVVQESTADLMESVAHTEGEHLHSHIEETPSIPVIEAAIEGSLEEEIPDAGAPDPIEDIPMRDALAQGEPATQGEPAVSALVGQFQEGLVEDVPDEDDDGSGYQHTSFTALHVELAADSERNGKSVARNIPMLTRRAHNKSRKKKIHVHLSPVIARLNAQGEILCSLQSDVTFIFLSQSTQAKDIGVVKSELHDMRSELGSLKNLVTDLAQFVREHLSAQAPHIPSESVPEDAAGPSEPPQSDQPDQSVSAEPVVGPSVEEYGPSGPSVEESGPSGSSVEESGPSGPSVVEDVEAEPSGPSKQMESVVGPSGPQVIVEEATVPPGPSDHPVLQTPAPSTPPTSFTAPPAPEPSKKTLPKHISSPTPFPAESSSSPTPSSSIPPPTSKAPPASSSGSSSAGPSSAGPSTQPPPTSSFSSLHPPTPPSFITLIPEGASIIRHIVQDIKDEFEEAILCTKEIKLISQFQMFNDYCFVNGLPEAQLGQFRVAISNLRTENPVNVPLQVDFASSKMSALTFLPQLHFLLMDSDVGPIIFERFARVKLSLFVVVTRFLSRSRSRQVDPSPFGLNATPPLSIFGSDRAVVAFMPGFLVHGPTLVIRSVLGTYGLVFREVVTVTWTPGPRASIEGVLQAASELELQTLVAEGKTVGTVRRRVVLMSLGLWSLCGRGKRYDMGDMVRKILRSLPASWTPKVTAIEEANDLKRMSLEKLIGSLMAHEINMERLGESSSRKKHSNALKAAKDTSGDESDGDKSTGSSEDEEVFLSRRWQRILAKKKYQIPLFAPKSLEGFYSTPSHDPPEPFPVQIHGAVKTKLCGNKAVDVADIEKNGMHNVIVAMQRMKWTRMITISEASYPDLVKAFYTCLKSEEDGSLISSVKGTSIHITYDLLESLFGVSTSGRSGVDSVDIHVKGLGIIGIEYKLKDGKIDINQMNAFNQILHFIVCQTLVAKSATFSTCPKADSDIMFWAIQNQDINMAEMIIERMKFATAMIWDKKNKLNVSLPYAHLLTQIFQHFNINVIGEVSEKMGQAIRSRNLKKSGFSLVAGVWTKTSVTEGEAIIGEAQEVQILEVEEEVAVRIEAHVVEAPVVPAVQEQPEEVRIEIPVVQVEEEEAALDIRIEVLVASPRRIEEISLEHIEPVGQSSEVESPSTVVAAVIEDILDTVTNIHGEQEEVMAEVVAPDHSADVPMEDALVQGEHAVEKEAEIYGEHTVSPHTDQFQEGVVESTSDEEEPPVDNVEPTVGASAKSKGVAQIPLLTRRAHRSSKNKKLRVNMKPVIDQLNAHREILCSLQNEVTSIFVSQSTGAKQIGAMKAKLQSLKGELGSIKKLVQDLTVFVREQLPIPASPAPTPVVPVYSLGPSGPRIEEQEAVRPSGQVNFEDSGPSGPQVVEDPSQDQPAKDASGPPGPSIEQAGPPGPVVDESRPSGPVESQVEHGRFEEPVEEVVPPEPPTSPFQTPAPPSPPSSTTTPPAPATFKQPLPKNISSPTPFPTTTSSSLVSSTFIPPPPSEAPPASSSVGASSSGPSSAGPSVPPPSTSYFFLHPPTPPSFVTIIPEGAQLEVQLGQFRQAISLLGSNAAHSTSIQVDFATFEIPDVVFLPPLYSLVMESAVGPLIFERFARVMGRISVQKGNSLAFHRFTGKDFTLSLLSSFLISMLLRYKVYILMKKELKHQQIFYPISFDQFLQHASFATSSTYKMSLGKDEYGNFVEAQRQLHIQRMAPVMGPSYSIVYGAFQGYFEEQECKAWPIITRYASLMSPAFYIHVPPQ